MCEGRGVRSATLATLDWVKESEGCRADAGAEGGVAGAAEGRGRGGERREMENVGRGRGKRKWIGEEGRSGDEDEECKCWGREGGRRERKTERGKYVEGKE